MQVVSNSGRNQVRLTNVSVVRLRKGGKRFEVAAYKNKVVNWRSGAETDLANVLQIASVFMNVSRGVRATAADLLAAFGTDDALACARMILEKGELEKGELERTSELDGMFRDIASCVAERCVNPNTQRPYPVAFVEAAMRDAGFSVSAGKSAKQQALKAIGALREHIPIERAKMALRVNVPSKGAGAARRFLNALSMELITSEMSIVPGGDAAASEGDVTSFDLLAEPGFFKSIEEALKNGDSGFSGGSLEVISLTAQSLGDQRSLGAGGGAGRGDNDDDDGDDNFSRAFSAARVSDLPAGKLGPSIVGDARAGATSAASGYDEYEAASARGTGMLVRRVVLPGRRLACNACGISLDSAEEHREHHRSDWHRFNLKRKVLALEPVPAEYFESMDSAARQAFLDRDIN